MEVKIITGTPEEIVKVLQAIESSKEHSTSVSIDQFAKDYENEIKQDLNRLLAD